MKKIKHILLILTIVSLCIQIFHFGLLIPGIVPSSYHGFAVDSKGCVYVGVSSHILVYDNCKLIRTLNIPVEIFEFTIDHKDTILLLNTGSPDHIYYVDLQGQIIDEVLLKENVGVTGFYQKYGTPNQSRKYFKAHNGKEYVRKSPFLRTSIYTEKHCVYKLPHLDYIARLLEVASYIMLPVAVIGWLYYFRKKGYSLRHI